MITLERNVGQGSKDAWAIVDRNAFEERRIDPDGFKRYCVVDADHIRIRISPTSYLYLKRLESAAAADEAIRAIPFAAINDRPRVWTTDFALLHGARTPEEVRAWERASGLPSQAKDVGSLRVPEVAHDASVFFDGSDDDVREHLARVFGTSAFHLAGDEIVLELPLTDKAKRPRPTGETVHVRVHAPREWSVEAPKGGQWWHVVPEGSDQTLCTIALSTWTTRSRRDDDHPITCPWCRARMIAIEIAAPPPTENGRAEASPDSQRPTLHEEIARILREAGLPMTTTELAAAVNEAGRYRKRDGSPVAPLQIHSRTRNYAHLFEQDGSRVALRNAT